MSEAPESKIPRSLGGWVIVHGLVSSLAYSVAEAAVNLPFLLSFRYEQPLRITAVAVSFHLLAALILSALCAPLLRLRAPRRLHALAVLVAWVALVAAVPSDLEAPLPARILPLAVTALLFGVVTWWIARRRPRRRWTVGLAVAAVLVVAALHAAPRLVATETRAELPAERSTAPAEAPNVLLVMLDTVRADRMEVAGYDRATFPVLDRLAQDGVVFERALSPAPWTVPSHASMFTGLYPSSHGAHHEHTALGEGAVTLAEILYAAGWDTAIFGSNPWVSHTSGLAQGFDTASWSWAESMARNTSFAYRLAGALGWTGTDHGGERVVDAWKDWASVPRERPFFAFLGFVETHIPYHQIPHERLQDFAPTTPRERLVTSSEAVQRRILQGEPIPGPRTYDDLGDVYDAGQHYVNDLVERSLEALRRADRAATDRGRTQRETLIVVVADHGDLLGEKGMVHHTRSLSERLLAVPLIFHWPAELPRGRRVETPVTTAALMPTVLDLVGLPVPKGLQVSSFASLVRGEGEFWPSPLLAEQYMDQHEVFGDYEPAHPFDRFGVRWRAFEEDGWKLVVDSDGQEWLFRPREDPDELIDLAPRRPEVVQALRQRLDRLVEAYALGDLDRQRGSEGDDRPEMDEATKKQLEALGYL